MCLLLSDGKAVDELDMGSDHRAVSVKMHAFTREIDPSQQMEANKSEALVETVRVLSR